MAHTRKRKGKSGRTPKSLLSIDKHCTLGRLSMGTHTSITYLSKIFSGKRMPSLMVAARLSAYLGCSMDVLYKALLQAQARHTPVATGAWSAPKRGVK